MEQMQFPFSLDPFLIPFWKVLCLLLWRKIKVWWEHMACYQWYCIAGQRCWGPNSYTSTPWTLFISSQEFDSSFPNDLIYRFLWSHFLFFLYIALLKWKFNQGSLGQEPNFSSTLSILILLWLKVNLHIDLLTKLCQKYPQEYGHLDTS